MRAPSLSISILASVGTLLRSARGESVKGVAPQDSAAYLPDAQGRFACLSDPSIKIPIQYVNDGYCDCPDGSDEPGTGACNNGKFWCANEGHIGQYIPSRLVGDGVCDYDVCCDGSDEASGLCPNRCTEAHAEWEKENEAAQKRWEEGTRKREEYIKEALHLREAANSELQTLTQNVAELRPVIAKAEAEKDEAEIADANWAENVDESLLELISDIKNKVQVEHSLAQALWDQAQRLRGSYEALDAALEKMSRDYNPNFNDPAVKEALQTWRDTSQDKHYGLSWSPESLDARLSQIDEVKAASSKAPSSHLRLRSITTALGLNSVVLAVQNLMSDWGWDVLSPPSGDVGSGGFVSPRVEEARAHVRDLQSELADAEKRIAELEQSLSTRYGPDDAGRALLNDCLEEKIGEYTFKVCFNGDMTQRGNGHSNVIGHSKGIESVDGDLYIRFVDGAKCWEGPNRSATAHIACGIENKLVSVEEPNKCTYVVQLLSPLACRSDASAGQQ